MPEENIVSDQSDNRGRPDKEPPWRLNVQGVKVESDEPKILVRRAIKLAGFNPDTGWIIVLKTTDGPKKEVGLDDVIDLRHPGIEKLRLTPRQIDNGEAIAPRRCDFALLPQDEVLLSAMGARWETALDGGRRWLLIYGYVLPAGFSAHAIDIAIEIPISYPGAQLDMFYCNPRVTLASGANIAQTEHTETIFGVAYQRWSRHRPWDSTRDTLATHLALVDSSLSREVGQ